MRPLEEMKKRLDEGFISNAEFLEVMRNDAKSESHREMVFRTKDGYKKCMVWNIPAAFDIETTPNKHYKVSYMYIWMLNINGVSTYGRTWNQFEHLMEEIRNIFNISAENQLYIYIHNEAYEMSFMMPRYADYIDSYFATDSRNPVKVSMKGIIFKDSYILSGLSLEKTADGLTKFKVRKQVGSLDYRKKRNSKTPLTEKELGYCLDDVRTLTAYIAEQIMQYDDDITKIPMTNTGRVREYYREHCLYKTTKSGKRVRNKKFCQYIKNKQLTPELYAVAKRAFAGGFTHAGHYLSGLTLNNVHSMDFTSSYPAVMVSEKFPAETPYEVEYSSWDEFYRDVDAGYGILFSVEIEDLNDSLFPYEHYISASKCQTVGYPKRGKDGKTEFRNFDHTGIDNGRIYRSDRITLFITEQDWDIISKTYDFSYARILRAWRFKKDYFPKEILDCLLTLYEKKTTLKGVEGMEAEYQLSKGMTNSSFGMMVQDVVNGSVTWNPDAEEAWECEPADTNSVSDIIDRYNKSPKRFTYFIDGVYITAYARHNLWEGIMELGKDYAYSDTDSVKFVNYKSHENFFNDYNTRITGKIDKCLKSRKIDISRSRPKTIKGEQKPLGVWDYEGYYDRFKTLGAKRYIIEGFHRPDGSLKEKYEITIAGVNKKKGGEYIFSQKRENGKKDPFELFNDSMTIPENKSGRLVSYYTDHPYGGIIVDEYGNAEMMEEYGGCYLEESKYSMSMSDEYAEYIGDNCIVSESMAVSKFKSFYKIK